MRLFLPVRPTSTIRGGAGDLGERRVGPAEAVARGALSRKRAPAPRPTESSREQVPVHEVVVCELGVVGDVLQVVEDLLARCDTMIDTVRGSTRGRSLVTGAPAGTAS